MSGCATTCWAIGKQRRSCIQADIGVVRSVTAHQTHMDAAKIGTATSAHARDRAAIDFETLAEIYDAWYAAPLGA